MLTAIEARLKEIPELKNRVYGAVDLAAMRKRGDAPQATPAQYVVDLRQVPEAPLRDTGAQLQHRVYHIAVVTVVRKANDPRGEAANEELQLVRQATQDKLYGWQPTNEFDALWLGPSGLVDFADGAVWYQDEFITKKLEVANA